MTRNLTQILAHLHAEFGIYDGKMFSVPDSKNIITQISSISELRYLHKFYLKYQSDYLSKWRKLGKRAARQLTNVSRSVDLPFIGESVIRHKRAKYMFVFEGSLSKTDKLSIAVLACLWSIPSLQRLNNIFQTFWPSSYFYIIECLGINVEIARQAYVVDAVRIGTPAGTQDRQRNRELLRREIEHLNPELVVLVGRTAANTVGNAELKERKNLYFKVPFPTRWRSKDEIDRANKIYKTLQKRLKSIK